MLKYEYIIVSNFNSLNDIEAKYRKLGVTLFLYETNNNAIKLSSLIIPKEVGRKSGIGTNIMNDIINYADKVRKTVVLNPAQKDDYHGTTSRARLIKFYKRFGFVENKGRRKDYRIGESMYRLPK